jgi:hypothetical protein
MPQIPASKTLNITANFNEHYSSLIEDAEKMKEKNSDLVYKLNDYIGKVERNRYNLEVFLSIANLERYFIKTVLTLNEAEELMLKAETAAVDGKPSEAIANLTEASNRVGELLEWSDWMWKNLAATWEKSRYKKNRSVAGRDYLHVMDDVKDHWADRRLGLDYMIAPFLRMDLPGWREQLNERINEYASFHNLKVQGLKEERLED